MGRIVVNRPNSYVIGRNFSGPKSSANGKNSVIGPNYFINGPNYYVIGPNFPGPNILLMGCVVDKGSKSSVKMLTFCYWAEFSGPNQTR